MTSIVVAPELLDSLLQAAIEVAKEAAIHFRAGFLDREKLVAGIETKSSAADLVTATDKLCETVIVESLRTRFPSHAFIGEEGVGSSSWPEDDTPTWIIDPIDGTTNFAHGFEGFTCISIGCVIRKQPVVGVVFAPMVDQFFSAAIGRGAFLNETIRLPVFKSFPPLNLACALVITEFGHSPAPEIQGPKQEVISKLIGNCRGIRVLGSAAMNMCTVAKGGSDIYYEKGIHCWDIAAAVVILREAGGYVNNFEPSTALDICARDIIAVRNCGSQGQQQQNGIAEELRTLLRASGSTAEGQYDRD